MEAHPLPDTFRSCGAAVRHHRVSCVAGSLHPAPAGAGYAGRHSPAAAAVRRGGRLALADWADRGESVRKGEDVLEAVVIEPGQQRMVVGVKRSAAALAALRWAAAEARLRRTTLHVVHTWEPAARPASYAIVGDRPANGQERHCAQDNLAAIMRAAFGAEPPAGVTVEVAEGMAERVLAHRSQDACL